jgi:uncharacterized repeat protein (TIGR03837 family)
MSWHTATVSRWDIFCHVVDHFGDIGVCWRLARQLTDEHGLAIRLWVDELSSFQALCPEVRVDTMEQTVHGVEVRRWQGDLADAVPGDVVVETFGCRLPDAFEAAMARRNPRPVWVNLEHLSAEAWVADYHTLPSPHPRLPLTKYFFFPGFSERTGGLLREARLERERRAFVASPVEREGFLRRLGVSPPDADTLLVSLFCYENPALPGLLDAWSNGSRPVLCLAPQETEVRRQRTETPIGFPSPASRLLSPVRSGRLTLRAVPFVRQADYDRLLWSCDLNLVRGEDSFVRAQWAARPMLWQVYAREDNAHRVKLAAFLDLWCAGLPDSAAAATREISFAWNGAGELSGELWERWLGHFPVLREHAGKWQEERRKPRDLCSCLVRFCQSGL